MAATPLLAFTLDKVKLSQEDSLEPYLTFVLNIKFRANGNNDGIGRITLLQVKTKVFVSTTGSRHEGQELGWAVSTQHGILPNVGADLNMNLHLPLSLNLLHKTEVLRGGADLYFFTYQQLDAFGAIARAHEQPTDIIWVNADQDREHFKYSRSEWIADLNTTDARSMIFDMPTVSLPNSPLTAEVTRFLNDAEGSFKEGRWGDVFGECRKALNVLYNGIEEWGKAKALANEQTDASARRNVYFAQLMGHPEKGERMNRLRTSLYQYLSLDPHEPDHKGVVFTRDDAMFALRVTYGIAANILHSLVFTSNSETVKIVRDA